MKEKWLMRKVAYTESERLSYGRSKRQFHNIPLHNKNPHNIKPLTHKTPIPKQTTPQQNNLQQNYPIT